MSGSPSLATKQEAPCAGAWAAQRAAHVLVAKAALVGLGCTALARMCPHRTGLQQ